MPKKEASALSVFMVEELGAARAYHARLKQYIEEALALVEKSGNRDHFFEVASHIVNGIPEALMGLEQALNSAALGAARFDYDDIMEHLPPGKGDNFEKSLEKVRIRRLTREAEEHTARSVPPPLPGSPAIQNKRKPTRDMSLHVKAMTAFNQYVRPRIKYEVARSLEQHVESTMSDFDKMRRGSTSGFYSSKFDRIKPPEADMGVWLDRVEEALEAWYSSLQGTIRKASIMNAKEAAERLEKFATQAETTGGVDSMALAEFVGQLEAGKNRTASEGKALGGALRDIAASLREGGDEAPSPLMVASILRRVMAENLDVSNFEERKAVKYMSIGTVYYQDTRNGEYYFLPESKQKNGKLKGKMVDALQRTPRAKNDSVGSTEFGLWQEAKDVPPKVMKALGKTASDQGDDNKSADEKEARFEEGKPADPTKNMSPEDAAKWKTEHEKNKDKFKTASDPWKAETKTDPWKA